MIFHYGLRKEGRNPPLSFAEALRCVQITQVYPSYWGGVLETETRPARKTRPLRVTWMGSSPAPPRVRAAADASGKCPRGRSGSRGAESRRTVVPPGSVSGPGSRCPCSGLVGQAWQVPKFHRALLCHLLSCSSCCPRAARGSGRRRPSRPRICGASRRVLGRAASGPRSPALGAPRSVTGSGLGSGGRKEAGVRREGP